MKTIHFSTHRSDAKRNNSAHFCGASIFHGASNHDPEKVTCPDCKKILGSEGCKINHFKGDRMPSPFDFSNMTCPGTQHREGSGLWGMKPA